MKKLSNGIFSRSFASALLVAAFCFTSAVAQVSVNAPRGLSNRSSSEMTGKKPASAAPSHASASTPASAPSHTATKSQRHKSYGTTPKQMRRGTAVAADGSMSGTSIVGQFTGYRVQVLFTSAKNGRALAQQRAKKIALKYPQYRAYMSYVAPRWRLRFGDFKTYNEAKSLARLIKRSFPEMRADVVIVTDKVNKFK